MLFNYHHNIMKKYYKILSILIVLVLLVVASNVSADARLAGMILLDVENNGEAWYVNPADAKRYYLGRPNDAFALMRTLGLGINETEFQKIPIASTSAPVIGTSTATASLATTSSGVDLSLAQKLSGKIILQVEKNGEAWYIYPKDLKKYYLGRPADAFAVMRQLGLGISRKDLAMIHKPGLSESIDGYSKYENKKITVNNQVFSIDVVEIDLSNPKLEITTPVAEPYPTEAKNGKYGGATLMDFVIENDGFAAMNGTYFCSSSGCDGTNYYFYPVYDKNLDKMVNVHQLKYWTTGPIMAWDENNKFYYFKDSRDFPVKDWYKSNGGKTVQQSFLEAYGVKLQAAIGDNPRLIENYMNYLIDWSLDAKQRTAKSLRNAIGYKDNKTYLVVARNATVPDLGYIMQELGMEYALNMDGGYSEALFYNGEMMLGPGRNIPNAIVFSERKNVEKISGEIK